MRGDPLFLTTLIYQLPFILLFQLYDRPLRYFIAVFDTIGYITGIIFSLLLTFNRLCIFMLPSVDRLLFQRPRIYYIITFIWVVQLCVVGAIELLGCDKDFDVANFVLYYDCPNDNASTLLGSLTWVRE